MKKKVPLFQPLRQRRFRDLFIANFFSNLGTWMQTFGATWIVAAQSRDPGTATLIQAVTYAPIFMFAFFGGALADRMDRSRYLLLVNCQMALSAALLALACWHARPTLAAILILTFLIGAGAAFKVSAWQSSMSELIAPDEIEAASTLHGLSYNLASIIGPLLGAWLFSRAGASVLFLSNALSFLGLIALYLPGSGAEPAVPAATVASSAPGSHFFRSLGDGIRICFKDGRFRAILWLTVALFISISAFNALLPMFVKTVLRAQESTLGVLMGFFGAGAVAAAFALPQLRSRLERRQLVGGAAAIYGAMLCLFGSVTALPLLCAAATVAGLSWAAVVSTMNSAAVAAFAPAMRARALAIYSMAFSGALIAGSFGWGRVANQVGIEVAFRAAGIAIALVAVALLASAARKALAGTTPRSPV
jgi:MFS family permease